MPRLAGDAAHERHPSPVAVEQALDVREEDEEIGLAERGHHRRELVVVAELDLLDRDGVVLVDDRDGARLEQRGQGVPRVVRARAVREVGVREEHLRDEQADLAEGLLVALHQHALARGGGGLEPGHVLRARLQPELRHAEGDGAARHDDEAPAGAAAARRDLGGEPVPGVAGEALRADLDDDAAAAPERGARGLRIQLRRGVGRGRPAAPPFVAVRSSVSVIGEAGGGDLVERRVEAALDVLRDGGAREQEGVDPARELVAQVLGAARQDGEARLEGGGQRAAHGAIDGVADPARLLGVDAHGGAPAEARDVAVEEVAEGVDLQAARGRREGQGRVEPPEDLLRDELRGLAERGLLRPGLDEDARASVVRLRPWRATVSCTMAPRMRSSIRAGSTGTGIHEAPTAKAVSTASRPSGRRAARGDLSGGRLVRGGFG